MASHPREVSSQNLPGTIPDLALRQSVSAKQILVSLGLALLAALLSFACWTAASFAHNFQKVFVIEARSGEPLRSFPPFVPVLVMSATALVTAFAIERLGARRALPWLTTGLLLLTTGSMLASWAIGVDIQLTPIIIATLLSAVLVQLKRICVRERRLTSELMTSAKNLNSLEVTEAQSRVMSGLKLIQTVLSPNEAVVFRFDEAGNLTVVARMRAASSGSLVDRDASRNSAWRGGVKLCERAIKENQMVTEQGDNGNVAISIAMPLRHESQTVGALLTRIGTQFEENDRDLLKAVAAQMARNLQREEALRLAIAPSHLSLFSAHASEQRFESLHMLNGLLSEQRFAENALSYISEGLALAYLDGTLAYANSSLLKYASLDDQQISSLDLFTLLNSFKTDVFDEPSIAVRRVLQTGEPYERELSFYDKEVTYGLRISLVRANAGPDKGEPLCIAVHLSDLTGAKEHEKLKSDMISLMSHELRTPLTSINGFAELLSNEEDLPEQAREFVTIIANESQRLSRMINTFLAVSQLQRKDKQEVLKIPLRLDEVAREIVTSMQPIARKRRIRLVDRQADRLPPVAADKSLITQAVKNLVHNAIKYSPEKTTVTVVTTLEAEAVRVSVEDRGYGIPAEARDRVWEKFYRVVREGQEKDEESTGLGLSFVREVVEQHGGEVGLESEEGRGSKFSFTLPRL